VRLAARLVAGDEAGAWSVVESALAAGVDLADLYLEILVPALRDIGDGWESGRLTVAHEHCATATAQRLGGRLGPMMARRGRKRGTVIVGAPAGELHALPCAIVADLLRQAGFDVVDLGASTPSESFVQTAKDATRLVAILLGVTATGRDREVRAVVRALRRAHVDVPVLVGGAAIPDEAAALALGADGWSGDSGSTAKAAVERLVDPPVEDLPSP
jgi:methanogenic corrinoid protein MtbC1